MGTKPAPRLREALYEVQTVRRKFGEPSREAIEAPLICFIVVANE